MTLSKEKLKRIKELDSQGMKAPDIAKEVGVSYNTVRYHIDPEFRKNVLEIARKYRQNPKNKEKVRAWGMEYRQRPDVIENQREYTQRPKVKAKMREMGRKKRREKLKARDPEAYHFVEFTEFVQKHSDFMETLQSDPEKYKGCLDLFESDEFVGTIYSLYVDNISNSNYCRMVLSYLNDKMFGANSKNIRKNLGIERRISQFLRYMHEHGITEKDVQRYILTDFGESLLEVIETYSAENI